MNFGFKFLEERKLEINQSKQYNKKPTIVRDRILPDNYFKICDYCSKIKKEITFHQNNFFLYCSVGKCNSKVCYNENIVFKELMMFPIDNCNMSCTREQLTYLCREHMENNMIAEPVSQAENNLLNNKNVSSFQIINQEIRKIIFRICELNYDINFRKKWITKVKYTLFGEYFSKIICNIDNIYNLNELNLRLKFDFINDI